jgi:alpha-mannosidase
MMLSLLRAHTLANYGFGGGFEPGMTSDSGYELGRERALHYALVPHSGDWRDAQIYREGLEFGHPLLCRKAADHAGSLPARWGLLNVSAPNVIVSSIQSGRDGAMLIRLFESTGKPAAGVKLTLAGNVISAGEVNLMEDPIAPQKPDGKTVTFDLSPFQIKTVTVKVGRE